MSVRDEARVVTRPNPRFEGWTDADLRRAVLVHRRTCGPRCDTVKEAEQERTARTIRGSVKA